MIQSLLPNTLVLQWQSNYRLRLGCWCIISIVLFLVFQFLSDATLDVKNSCRQQDEQITRLKGIAGKGVWLERYNTLTSDKKDIESRLLAADSGGLAQAATQTWLTSLLNQQTVKNSRVKVSPPVPLTKLPRVWQVSAALEGDFVRQSFFRVLIELESVGHLVVVDRLEVTGRKKQRFAMDVKVFCLIAE